METQTIKPKSSAKFVMSLLFLLGFILTGWGIRWVIEDGWDLPVVAIMLGLFVLSVAFITYKKNYRKFTISDEGFRLGRTLYPWDQVSPAGKGSVQVNMKAAYVVTVASRRESYINLLLGPRDGNSFKRFRVSNIIFPSGYGKVLFQIKERNKVE